jgi:toxin-antitoxin system, toxin component, PIN family
MKYICFYMVKRAGNLTDNAADKTTGIVLVKKTPYFLLYILKEQALHALRRAPAFGKPNY